MNEQLKLELTAYKEASLNIKTAIENQNIGVLKELMEKRQSIIEVINELEYSRQDFSDCCNELGLVSLEKELKSLVENKLEDTKDHIEKLAMHKNARKSYNSKISVDSLYFNKKL